MGFFKSWKFIFFAAIFLLFGIFYVYLLADEIKPPAKGWSNKTVVDEINNSKVGDFSRGIWARIGLCCLGLVAVNTPANFLRPSPRR